MTNPFDDLVRNALQSGAEAEEAKRERSNTYSRAHARAFEIINASVQQLCSSFAAQVSAADRPRLDRSTVQLTRSDTPFFITGHSLVLTLQKPAVVFTATSKSYGTITFEVNYIARQDRIDVTIDLAKRTFALNYFDPQSGGQVEFTKDVIDRVLSSLFV